MARPKTKPTHLIALMQRIEGLEPHTILSAIAETVHGHLVSYFVKHPYTLEQLRLMPCQVKVMKKVR